MNMEDKGYEFYFDLFLRQTKEYLRDQIERCEEDIPGNPMFASFYRGKKEAYEEILASVKDQIRRHF